MRPQVTAGQAKPVTAGTTNRARARAHALGAVTYRYLRLWS